MFFKNKNASETESQRLTNQKSKEAEPSISDLMNDFSNRSGLKIESGQTKNFETSIQEPSKEAQLGIMEAPLKVAATGLVIFGGGYFYLRKPYQASLIFFILSLMAIVFLSLLGVVPSSTTQTVLYYWDQIFKGRSASLFFLTLVFILVWWLSVIVPVQKVIPYFFVQKRSKWFLLTLSAFPFFGSYARGKYWHGHLGGLGAMFFVAISAVVIRMWISSGYESALEIEIMQPYLLVGFILLLIFGCFTMGFVFSNIQANFTSNKQDSLTHEVIKAVWGSVALSILILFLYLGPFKGKMKEALIDFSHYLEGKKFTFISNELKEFSDKWEKSSDMILGHFKK